MKLTLPIVVPESCHGNEKGEGRKASRHVNYSTTEEIYPRKEQSAFGAGHSDIRARGAPAQENGGRRRLRAELHAKAPAPAGGRGQSAHFRMPARGCAQAGHRLVPGRDPAQRGWQDQLQDAEHRHQQVPGRPRARRRHRNRRGPLQGQGQEQDGRGRGLHQPQFQS